MSGNAGLARLLATIRPPGSSVENAVWGLDMRFLGQKRGFWKTGEGKGWNFLAEWAVNR